MWASPLADGCNPEKYSVPIIEKGRWDAGKVWTTTKNLGSTGIRSPYSPAHSGCCTIYTNNIHIKLLN
jgi:hypothetical protein